MKTGNKILSTLLSWLMVMTCVPVQVFAQQPHQLLDKISIEGIGERAWQRLRLYSDGSGEQVVVSAPFQVLEANGGETVELAGGVTRTLNKGEALVLSPVNGELRRVNMAKFAELYRPAPYLGEGWFMSQEIVVRKAWADLKITDLEGKEVLIKEGEYFDLLTGHPVTLEKKRVIQRFNPHDSTPNELFVLEYKMDKKSFFEESQGIYYSERSAWSSATLDEFIKHDTEHVLFGEPEIYAYTSRIQAEKVTTGVRLADGQIAMPGDYITKKNGKQAVINGEWFEKTYERAYDMGEANWWKHKGGFQEMVQLKRNMLVRTQDKQGKQLVKAGGMLNITDRKAIVGRSRQELLHMKPVTKTYAENAAVISEFADNVRKKLTQKYAGFSGSAKALKGLIKRDAKGVAAKLEEQSGKQAQVIAKGSQKTGAKQAEKTGAKQAEKLAAEKASMRVIGGVLLGVGLYAALSLADLHAQGNAIVADGTHSVQGAAAKIKRLRANLQDTQKDHFFENMQLFQDEELQGFVMDDPALMDETGLYSAIIQTKGEEISQAVEAALDTIEKEASVRNNLVSSLQS